MRHRSKTIWTTLVTLPLALSALSSSVVAEVDCFRWSDNRKLQFDVFQIGAPPRHTESTHAREDAGSPVLPASDFVTKSVVMLNGAKSGEHEFKKHYLLWANRCIFMNGYTPNTESCRNTTRTKGNGYPSMSLGRTLSDQLRAGFSTYAKANTCTILNAMKVLGESEGALIARAKAANVTLIAQGTAPSELNRLAQTVAAGNGKRARYLVDICVLENQPIARDVAGIVLDYEVFDGRTPTETLSFLRELQTIVKQHSKTLIVATNPLPRPPNGIDETNIHAILNLVNGFAVPISSGGSPGNSVSEVPSRPRRQSPVDDYKKQLAIIAASTPLDDSVKQKLLWNVSLYDLKLAEAKELQAIFKAQNYHGIMIFRNYVKPGGSCSRPENQTIACLAFGDCDGYFGRERRAN